MSALCPTEQRRGGFSAGSLAFVQGQHAAVQLQDLQRPGGIQDLRVLFRLLSFLLFGIFFSFVPVLLLIELQLVQLLLLTTV